MPNLCYAEVMVKGRKECVDEFEKVLTANYDYSTNTFSHKPHLWRIFDVSKLEYIQTGLFVCAKFWIECAWSVSSCMMNGPCTYYNSSQEQSLHDMTEQRKLQLLYSNKPPRINYGTNIVALSMVLNLEIEIISEECGIGFMEHYKISHGQVILDDCIDMTEHFIGEYNTLKEYKDEWPNSGIDLTEEQFQKLKNQGEDFYRQGGIPYDFDMSEKPNYITKIEMCKIINPNK